MAYRNLNNPKRKRATTGAPLGDSRLVVWGERREDPDWDRFLAALLALALRRVEEAEAEEASE
jgi:hypothetical protein